jgi:acetylornithine deacetylase/succinyl-diaminopimelate desuccinylase-like protein
MDGVNAIEMMCELVDGLRTVVTDYPSHELIGPPSLNLGMLQGGDRPNRVPDRCEASVDIRVVPPMTVEEILEKIARFFDGWKGRAEYVVAKQGNPLNTPLDSILLDALRSTTEAVCGAPSNTVGWRGWTEAEPFQTILGADAAVLGAGSLKQAHSANEFVDLEQVKKAARIYVETARLILR